MSRNVICYIMLSCYRHKPDDINESLRDSCVLKQIPGKDIMNR